MTGLTFQWEQSPDGIGSWANVTGGSGATTTTYTTPVLATTTYYRMRVTCANGGGTAVSSNVCQANVVNCSYDVVRGSGTYTSIMPANGGSGLPFPGWQSATEGDDNTSTTVSLAGTTFRYQGSLVAGFQSCSNGWMTFNTANTSTAFSNDLTSTSQNRVLAPFWDDLVFTGQAYANRDACMAYQVSGSLGSGNAVITIEWAGLERFNIAGPNLNFQVKLYEAGNVIEFIYGNFEGFDGTVTSAYSYSIGYNGTTPSGTTAADRFMMQTGVTNHWGTTNQTGQIVMPDCFTKFTLTPGTYTGPTSAPTIPAPANDNIGGAITILPAGAPCTTFCGTYFTSRSATNSGLGGNGCTTSAGAEDDDVWFTFTADGVSDYLIRLRSSPNYDGVLQLIAGNGTTNISCVNATGTGLIESITSGVLAAGPYYVRVFHNGSTIGTSSGQFSLCISAVQPPPANDNICGAIALGVNASCVNTSGNTLTATASAQAACAGTPDDDIWYSFVAATPGVTITVDGLGSFNAHLQVFSSSDNTCTGTLTSLACINNTSTGGIETYSGPWTVGNTYFVRVYHTTGGAATGQFDICVTGSAPSCVTSPTAPANGSVICGNGSPVTLSWPAVASATSYNVYLDGGTVATTLVSTAQTGTTYAMGIIPFGPYAWRIEPQNALGQAVGCADFTFNVNPVPVASASSNSPVCVGAPINLFGGSTLGGSTFAWTGPNAFSTQNPSITSAALTDAGTYSLIATAGGCPSTPATTAVVVNAAPVITSTTATPSSICSGGTSQLQVSIAGPSYCASTHTNGCGAGDEYIAQVSFGTINNASTCAQNGPSQYTDYTGISTAITAGSATPISVGNPNSFSGDQCRVYVDWNQDGDFLDAGEETILSGTSTFTGTVNAPAGALNGSTRMRVRLTYTSGMAPCGVASFGETEDYTLIVSGGVNPSALTYSWNNAATLDNAAIANPVSSATTNTAYTVTVSNGLCPATGNTSLTVNALPTASASGGGTVCSTDPLPNVTFAFTGTAPFTFTYDPGNVTVTNHPNTTYTITGAGAGVYAVTAVSDASCPVTDLGSSATVIVNTPPAATTTIVPACGSNSFSIDVNISSLGNSTTVDLVPSAGSPLLGISATGTYTVGPYTSGSSVSILLDAVDHICDVNFGPLSFTCPPPNDNCANAIPVACNSITLGYTPGASNSGNPGTCTTDLSTAPGVWYTVTGWGGSMTASLCGSSYDTKLGVVTGSCGGPWNCVGGNDDFCSTQSQVTWTSTVGVTYYLYVTGFGTASGNFILEVSCGDENPPCTGNTVVLSGTTDGSSSSQNYYEITPVGLSTPVCSSSIGEWPNNGSFTNTCCLPDGCYRLRFFDGFGDGMSAPAGYMLTDGNGDRIIDNSGNGFSGTESSIANMGGFCLPLGTDRLKDGAYTSGYGCDRMDYGPNDYMVAKPNPAVSGSSNPTTGYQFWIFDPNGSYSRRVFQANGVNNGHSNNDPDDASYLRFGWIQTLPVPTDIMLNVRVRSRIAGVYGNFGPACRAMVLSAPPACPTTKLVDDPNNANYSCGVVRTFGGSDKVHAIPVAGANKYRFRFENAGEGYLRNIASNTSSQLLNWGTNPITVAADYDVSVQVSFDGGSTYCPLGPVCTVSIVFPPASANRLGSQEDVTLNMWPNPNRGDQLYLTLSELEATDVMVQVDIFDMYGKRIVTRSINAQGGMLNTVIELNNEIASGLYLVNITASGNTWTERLVIQ